jgi:FAD binding domain
VDERLDRADANPQLRRQLETFFWGTNRMYRLEYALLLAAVRSRYNPAENGFAEVKPSFRGKDMTKKNKTTAITEENKTLRELKNTKGMVVGQDRIERFQAAFRGEVIQPADFGYEKARKIWNASIDKHPGIIARCAGVADVKAAVNFARENELLVAVRGGGHNVSGRALCDDGIVIDLSGMKGIHVNAKNHTARVQGGATLGDLDRETQCLWPGCSSRNYIQDGHRWARARGRCRLAGQEIRSDL